jgi:hypothetical protein
MENIAINKIIDKTASKIEIIVLVVVLFSLNKIFI